MRHILVVIAAILAFATIMVAWPQQPGDKGRPLPQIRPAVPTANRQTPGRVFLEHADNLRKSQNDSFIVVVGNVHFSKGPMQMYCDSAHFFPSTESMDAFGNVRMRQGDTLFIYGDELNYDGLTQIAYLYGDEKEVRLINRDVMLETMVFVYDLGIELGYYTVGGKLTDDQNRLTSLEGEYIPSTKEANFYTRVHLNSRNESDTLDIYTDTLFYNTATHVANLFSPSKVVNAQATIFTDNGSYNTTTNVSELFDRSIVVTPRGNTLTGDTLFYDRNAGYGEAFGNMVLVDSVRQTTLMGNYGYYNEVKDSAYVTGHALAIEHSRPDTLYMHGRQIQSFLTTDTVRIPADTVKLTPDTFRVDTTHIMVAFPRVRFFRNDMQGICDSMRFQEKDTTLYMFRHPVIWSDQRQVFGNHIKVHLNDSTIDRAKILGNAFSAQHVEEEFYDQLAGKEMDAYFDSLGNMERLEVSGNVQSIMVPQENDSTYNKITHLESSYLTAWFQNQAVQRMKTWPESTVTSTPLFLARRNIYYLPQFRWYEALRPRDPEDVFNITPEFEYLMDSPE